jgi:hypothetical protein
MTRWRFCRARMIGYVIARSRSDEAIQNLSVARLDRFAIARDDGDFILDLVIGSLLAMTNDRSLRAKRGNPGVWHFSFALH